MSGRMSIRGNWLAAAAAEMRTHTLHRVVMPPDERTAGHTRKWRTIGVQPGHNQLHFAVGQYFLRARTDTTSLLVGGFAKAPK